MSIFGGGFTGSPRNAVPLRPQGTPVGAGLPSGTVLQQFTQPMRQLGVVPAGTPLGVVQPAPRQYTPAAPVQPQGAVGPASYPVMKKGEAPCPICRG
jgi:hypothetical protein